MSHRSVPQQRATIKAINAAPIRPSSTLALYILSLRKNIQGIVLHPKHPYPNKYALAVLKRTISEYNFEGEHRNIFPFSRGQGGEESDFRKALPQEQNT